MKKSAKKLLAVLFSLLGTVLATYVGGYWLFARPLYFLFAGFSAGTLTMHSLTVCVIKIFVASTVGGGIWCIFDIIAGYFRDEPRD